MNIFKNLYNYREFLKTSVKKDVRGKYKNSFLGVIWSFLNPLLQIAVYAFVFGKILNANEENYAVFICCGLIPWTFFSASINRSSFSMVENGSIIKKVYFPREVIPISIVTAEAVNFVISSFIILGFVIVSGVGFSWHVIFYPIALFVLYTFLVSAAFFLSSITVYVRDLQHFVGVILQLMFYATPIAYSAARVPASFKWVIKINPVAYIIDAFRKIFIYHQLPDFSGLGMVFAISLVLFVVGYLVFSKLQKGFAEQL